MSISTKFGTAENIMQFGIFVFVEAQDINLQGNLQGSKFDRDCVFSWEHFSFYEKVPSSHDRVVFTPSPSDVFN